MVAGSPVYNLISRGFRLQGLGFTLGGWPRLAQFGLSEPVRAVSCLNPLRTQRPEPCAPQHGELLRGTLAPGRKQQNNSVRNVRGQIQKTGFGGSYTIDA